MSSAAPADYRPSAAAASGELDSAVLDRVAAAAERLGLLVGELRQEAPTGEWSAADRLTARLLLDELTTAVRGCRTAAAAAACLLAALGLAYYFTVVPAPAMNVRWREDVTAERRAAFERRFPPRPAEGERGAGRFATTCSTPARVILQPWSANPT